MSKHLIVSIGTALIVSACAAQGRASAAGWRLNPALCPDIREDIRDARITRSRRDYREDIRDQSVTVCPASAWTYVVPARTYVAAVPPRPVYTGIYVAPRRRYYGYHGRRRVRINVHLH